MKISVCLTGIASRLWVSGLRDILPDTEVTKWVPGSSPSDYAIVWDPPQQFIDEHPQLKAIFNIGAGVDSLLKLRVPSNIPIVRLDDSTMPLQMTEYVCHSVIRYFREFESYSVDKTMCKWSYRKTSNRNDFTVGVMGLGRLGMHLVKTLQVLGYSINGYSRTIKEIKGVNCYIPNELSEFLKNTRLLVNLLPLTPTTENILNYQTLSQLKPGSYVINVARGDHLVDEDLLTLLNNGHLAGATLDVFRTEPLPASHAFWQHPKINITPHIASRVDRDDSISQIAEKIQKMELGLPISGIVDPSLGY